MDIWSRPVGRLTGVVVATVSVPVAIIGIVAVGLLVAGKLPDVFDSLRGPEMISERFPRECLEQMGDLTPQSGDVAWSIVWLGSEEELTACNQTLDPEGYEASLNPDSWKTVAGLRMEFHESDEFEPPSIEELPLPEECLGLYDDEPLLDEDNAMWVFAFEGTYEDFLVCNRAMFSDALNDPASTIYSIAYRGVDLVGGFRFVTPTPTP